MKRDISYKSTFLVIMFCCFLSSLGAESPGLPVNNISLRCEVVNNTVSRGERIVLRASFINHGNSDRKLAFKRDSWGGFRVDVFDSAGNPLKKSAIGSQRDFDPNDGRVSSVYSVSAWRIPASVEPEPKPDSYYTIDVTDLFVEPPAGVYYVLISTKNIDGQEHLFSNLAVQKIIESGKKLNIRERPIGGLPEGTDGAGPKTDGDKTDGDGPKVE